MDMLTVVSLYLNILFFQHVMYIRLHPSTWLRELIGRPDEETLRRLV